MKTTEDEATVAGMLVMRARLGEWIGWEADRIRGRTTKVTVGGVEARSHGGGGGERRGWKRSS